ncbi:hypothetical protein MKW94_003189 [Papaver nudicaule]|uniref:Uncharacterized protein n=1 Tax=Papaver nudicaule TaxID=74823 RepID=A0AA41RSU0_PAPNU|nr:hypothetical protein [Papaver nudicaule]
MKFHVMDALLTQFYLTSDDILQYNLALNIFVRNSDKMTGISYSYIDAAAYCYGKNVALVPLMPFQQDSKNTTLLRPVFRGQTSFKLLGSDLVQFSNDQRDGRYPIYIKLHLKSKLLYGGERSSSTDGTVNCGWLRLPLLGSSSDNNQTVIGFKTERCRVIVHGIYITIRIIVEISIFQFPWLDVPKTNK